MVSKITIENFKSIEKLDLELGRFNIFIGANGSGKSNIIEAIAFGGAAAANKLDHEFLGPRGIRVTRPELMRSSFNVQNTAKRINISYTFKDVSFVFKLNNENKTYSKWKEDGNEQIKKYLPDYFRNFLLGEKNKIPKELTEEIKTILESNSSIKRLLKDLYAIFRLEESSAKENVLTAMSTVVGQFLDKTITLPYIENFIVFSPENTALRNFYEEGQIEPLGVKGEGLLKLLRSFQSSKIGDLLLEEIKSYLQMIDWFDDFEIPKGTFIGENYLSVKDRYVDENLAYFDQRSANEGFLFLLFYFALFISDNTPSFFAIDNIEGSLNPKLCTELTVILNELSTKHKKQVILTTHNPAILDGINLNDDDQRLFVVSRDLLGHTMIDRIKPKKNNKSSIKLSEAWLRGYLGGLPDNF